MAEISPRERALMQSTGSLLEHFEHCEDCDWGGISRCDDVSSLLAVLRADRDEPGPNPLQPHDRRPVN